MGTITANQRFDMLAPAYSDLSGLRPYVGNEFEVGHGAIDFLILRFASGASYLFGGDDFDIGSPFAFSWLDGTVEEIHVISDADDVDVEDVALDAVQLGNFLINGDGLGFWTYVLSGRDEITGSRFSDRIYGYAGDDVVSGRRGNDVLEGGRGRDTLNGGPGNDKLHGGPGRDTLDGDGGRDAFVFDTPLSSPNRDLISSFSPAYDDIHLDDDIFRALSTPAGTTLQAAEFRANASGTARDADDRIIYDTSSGALFYDTDGNGPRAAVQFATLTGAPDIDETDFLIAG